MPKNSVTSCSDWAKTKSGPRETTGTLRAPSACSAARPSASSRTLMESYSIFRDERNSFALRQLLHPGCQKTLIASLMIPLPLRLKPILARFAMARTCLASLPSLGRETARYTRP